MKKNTSKLILKCFHIVLSLIILGAAIYLFVFACLKKSQFSTYSPYLYDYSSKPVLLLLVGSALAIAVSFFGIISVCQEWIRGTVIFTLFILYLLISMIALVTTAYFLSSSVDEKMLSNLRIDMATYESNKMIVDNLQVQLSCCGIKDFTDWTEFLDYIPGSCCHSPAFCDSSELSKLHLAGCYTALKDIVEYSVTIIFFVLVGLAVVEIGSIVTSIFLVICLKRERKGGNGNSGSDSVQLPRIQNPLGYNTTPSVIVTSPQGTADKPLEPIYIRRPMERPIMLAYRSPHENYLHGPPQYRFDSRRISFTNSERGKRTPHVYDSSRYS
ncbi:CD63 antigen-like [Diachasmimorpha longicaudata]|uniref:CD63 antigen-like n=1 Tax=Diachasmimorpha longicaudata TaxID=58733 RepID=UPI0030B8C251